MLSEETIQAGMQLVYDCNRADQAIRELAKKFVQEFGDLSGRMPNEEFDYSKLEETNLLRSYGEGDRFGNNNKKINREDK